LECLEICNHSQMPSIPKKKRLHDAYRFPGFRPLEEVKGVFGDPFARVVTLVRRSKKHAAVCVAASIRVGMTGVSVVFAICHAGHCGCIWSSRFDAYAVGTATP
jgi:hypothetical protein